MALPAIATDIFAITARPDRTAETELGIRQALQYAHSIEEFPNDLRDVRMQADALDYNLQATLDITVRKISHIVPEYLQADGSFIRGNALHYVEPRAFHNRDAQNIDADFYYIAGQTLNIKIRSPTTYFQLGYWAYPDLDTTSINNDWIVKNYSMVVIAGAAMHVFTALGNAADAATYRGMYQSALEQMRVDAIFKGDVADASVLDTESDWGGQ